jgi:peptidoglycan hydrolase-like protein with peptidoglycan-binding domain
MSSPSPFGPAPSLDAVRAGNAQIQRGHKGDAVAKVQFLVGVFDDGGFGQRTQNAISAFQERNGIAVSEADKGKVDAQTLSALEAAYEPTRVSLAKIDKRNKTPHLMLEFRRKMGQFAEALTARGMEALITDAFRTFPEQDALFAKGRTKGGKKVTNARGGESNHNYGMAVDLYPVINDNVFTEPTPANKHRFEEIQQAIIDEAQRIGLTSGVTFSSLGDKPHVQLLSESGFNAKHKCLPIFQANGNSFDAVWDEARKLL